jgi:Integrase core domain
MKGNFQHRFLEGRGPVMALGHSTRAIHTQTPLRVLDVKEIKTVPYVPLSHPFVERLVGTIRREYLDQTLFWTAADLEEKLRVFERYFNRHRAHSGLEGGLPEPGEAQATLSFASYR